MPARLSGVEAIGPAFERAKRQLFTPFRFGHWSRLAIVVMSTGEVTGGGGGGWSGLSSLPGAASGSGSKQLFGPHFLPETTSFGWAEYFPWIVAGFIFLVLFALAFIYVACVFRFILFDSVLHDRCELGEGWRRFQQQGQSYFLWTLGFAFSGLTVMSILVGVPAYLAWISGVFNDPARHIVLLVIGGISLFFLALTVFLVGAIVSLLAKDIVVPVMALENLGVMDAWRLVLPMLGAEKGAYTLYVLMKVGLGMGVAMLFGIVNFLVLFIMLVPLSIIAVAVVLLGAAAGLTWNTFTLCMAVLVGGLVLMVVIYVICFVSVPSMVFFQSYTLHFLGSRYSRLGAQLDLTSPTPAIGPVVPGSAAPLPAS